MGDSPTAEQCDDTHGQAQASFSDNDYPEVSFRETSVPNVARIYDCLLGGKENLAVDRQAAAKLLEALPDAQVAAKHNREFLGRAVEFLARDCGIRQFIDIGTGLPTRGNVHEVAREFALDARVLYVDNDPLVVTHAQALLLSDPTAVAINRDLRDPDEILKHPALRALIDIDAPVAVLLVAVLHFIKDSDKPYEIVERLKDTIAPGSYLVVTHVTGDDLPVNVTEIAQALYKNSTAPGVTRTRQEITRFFDGLDLVPPGVVNGASWRARPPVRKPDRTIFYAGIAQKQRTDGARK